jgi:hypothetical protein
VENIKLGVLNTAESIYDIIFYPQLTLWAGVQPLVLKYDFKNLKKIIQILSTLKSSFLIFIFALG